MSHVYLGKLTLYWCDECNVPLLGKKCAKCGSAARYVDCTPPGDIRPAFPYDIDLINSAAEDAFGHSGLIPKDKLVVLNKAPYEDRLDEIYVDGRMFGAIRFDPSRLKWMFMPRAFAARQMEVKKGFVIADKGAEKPLLGSSNLLGPGVVDCDPDIKIDDEVIVLLEGRPIAVGRAKMAGEDMKQRKRGVAVKVRWNGYDESPILMGGQTWDDAIEANNNYLGSLEGEAVNFVRKAVDKYGLPVAVSYSGGKDSLATLLLVQKAITGFDILYINTGLEFPETTKNVYDVVEKYGLKLKTAEAESFWDAAPNFGPPSVEARWCCKVCKLGPITNLIEGSYADGCLTFIGQRRYESEIRAKSQRIWQNPWVTNQISASPIQNWTALHIWLYLFREKAPYNSLYERGFDRIGCWLCPSASLSDYEYVKREHPDMWARWSSFLEDYCKKVGYPAEYITYGFWRWRNLPKPWEELRQSLGITLNKPEYKVDTLNFVMVAGHRPCKDGSATAEGSFDKPLDLERLQNMLKPLGEVKGMDGVLYVSRDGGSLQVYATGTMVARAKDKDSAASMLRMAEKAVRRGMLCIGCGVCVGACPINAITKENHKVTTGDDCNGCGSCIDICPLVKFQRKEEHVS
ncbi:phosphoadenosine phosphosulfate reductase [Methanocella sp. CWC-04]|uniref:Phosphoadenosine phosphosulfate reductase n=1 Tax=Methanooceanicella nereidis TaxID=2052831 RepID=A0AAP2W4X3_9EURY|nr:phosphoadenosine phosphosulfate reductase family protein [Methanocella sp. CWC-04]MCD1294855.1 phosphoadenosine phosphosulfate reductase [Methanocella sp. CWC-04]